MDINSQSQRMPNSSEPFRTVPQPSESFGNIPHAAERSDQHTLTVREVARMFEVKGVARTERSIVNWCQPNPQGVSRLDAYFDMNDRRWFITPQSVESAIAEEQAKAAKSGEPNHSETVPNSAEGQMRDSFPQPETAWEGPKELRQELLDLKITNRAKDMFIEQLQMERKAFADERREYVEKLMSFNRKVGELETTLRQLAAPPSGAIGERPTNTHEERVHGIPE